MANDRAGNTLRKATQIKQAVSAILKDGISKVDGDDLYSFRLGDRSQLNLQVLKIKPGAEVGAEIFQLKGKKSKVLKKIGAIAFNALPSRRVRQLINRLSSPVKVSKATAPLNTVLNAGDYYLRVFFVGSQTQYRLNLTTQPVSAIPQPIPGDPQPIPGTPVNTPPVLSVNTGLGVGRGSTASLGGLLAATDADTPTSRLTYTLQTLPTQGSLFRNSVLLSVGQSFTQEDLGSNLVTYQHQQIGRLTDAFSFVLSDEQTALSASSFQITATPATTTLYNGTGLPTGQGWLGFGQLPLPSAFNFPPYLSNSVSSASQTAGSNGVTLNTQVFPNPNANQGYVGYGNYTANLTTQTALLVNSAFPILDRADGFTLSFQLALTTETSAANRAGFSLTLLSNDSVGIELGFKSTQIFAQSNNFEAAESVAPGFSLSNSVNYAIAVKDNGYQLFANNALILSGALRTYNFDPTTSQPRLPFNPYALPNFLVLGDNTDQGRATITLGAITIQA